MTCAGPDLIFSLNRKEICCIATRVGFLYGIRSDKDKRHGCGNCPVDFVDIDFRKPDQKYHDKLVMRYKPKYAAVLDITDSSMLDSAILTASWYAGHGIEPIVIPKINVINEIPAKFILGYSVPTKYGATAVPIDRFSQRKIHLLGGTPKQQLEYYIRFLEIGCHVTSIDGNAICKAAVMGSVFVDKHGSQWDYKYKGGGHYLEALAESLQNLYAFWQEVFIDPLRGEQLWITNKH